MSMKVSILAVRGREIASWTLGTAVDIEGNYKTETMQLGTSEPEAGSSPRRFLGLIPREVKMVLTPDNSVSESTRQHVGTAPHPKAGQVNQGASSSLTVHI